jgi:hypothetical protein
MPINNLLCQLYQLVQSGVFKARDGDAAAAFAKCGKKILITKNEDRRRTTFTRGENAVGFLTGDTQECSRIITERNVLVNCDVVAAHARPPESTQYLSIAGTVQATNWEDTGFF